MSSLTTPLSMCAGRFEDMSVEMFRRFRQTAQIGFDVPGKVWADVGGDDQATVSTQQGSAVT